EAPVRTAHAPYRLLPARAHRDVELEERRLAAALADLGCGRSPGRLHHVSEHHRGALLGEHPRLHPALPAAAAGDEDDLVRESLLATRHGIPFAARGIRLPRYAPLRRSSAALTS